MMGIKVLVADDDSIFCRLVKDILQKDDYQVTVALDVEEARRETSNQSFDIIMLDMCFPSLRDGFQLLDEFHSQFQQSVILMISGSGHIPDAVLAVKNGAADFIEKPIEPRELSLRVQALADRINRTRASFVHQYPSIGMVGTSKQMISVFESIVKASSYDTPVLITGETGVGKELAAHAIHRLSKYATKPMVSINCASVPKDLFEAELFGYEQGAFTGATKSREGYFEFARDNSIFLDEIIELPKTLQAKLLRVISEGEIQKVGGKVVPINTRIISATNQDIEAAVVKGLFREDLLYRLNTLHLRIPPLRERVEDIAPLARNFVKDFCARNDLPVKQITPNAMAWLQHQPWNGNGRELRNSVERALIFARGDELDLADFTSQADLLKAASAVGADNKLRDALRLFERNYIEYHYRANNYNLTRTAEAMGIDKSNLSKKISALSINPHDL